MSMENPQFGPGLGTESSDTPGGVNFELDSAREKRELASSTGHTEDELNEIIIQEAQDIRQRVEDRRNRFPFELA